MTVFYGVLRGKVDRWKREEAPPGSPKSPHLQIRVLDGDGTPWRVPVNVQSQDTSLVIFHEPKPLLSHPILNQLQLLATGLTDLNHKPRSATNALDYLRAPLFDWPTGVALRADGPGPDDDIQDMVSQQLDKLQQANGELFAFGSHWRDPVPKPGIDTEYGTVNGMHDIHMNQGNPSGSFSKDNGAFNDGGLILSFPDHLVGLCFRFKTQWLPTDAHGNRIPGISKEIPAGAVPTAAPDTDTIGIVSPAFPHVYVERALVNPIGDPVGKQTVVIGNTTSNAVDLSRWSIVDQDNLVETLGGALLPAGASVPIVLSGNSAWLSNKGGTIHLVNPDGVLIHAVSYSKDDAIAGRFIRFNM